MIGEVHEQDRILDLDPDQGDEADAGRKGDRVPGEQQQQQSAQYAQRHDRQHDQRGLEVAELQHEDREDAEHRHDDRRPNAAKSLLARLRLAAQGIPIAPWPNHRVQPPDDIPGDLRSVISALNFGLDADRPLAIVAGDLARSLFKLQRGQLRYGQRGA